MTILNLSQSLLTLINTFESFFKRRRLESVFGVIFSLGENVGERSIDVTSERLELLATVLRKRGAEMIDNLVNGGDVVVVGLFHVAAQDSLESAAASAAAGTAFGEASHCVAGGLVEN